MPWCYLIMMASFALPSGSLTASADHWHPKPLWSGAGLALIKLDRKMRTTDFSLVSE
jgi:hypothetical protein